MEDNGGAGGIFHVGHTESTRSTASASQSGEVSVQDGAEPADLIRVQDPLTAWQVTAEDWEHHSKYDDYLLAVEEMLERTNTEWGPWTIVEATDRYWTHVKIFRTIIAALEERLGKIPGALPPAPPPKATVTEDLEEEEAPTQEMPPTAPAEDQAAATESEPEPTRKKKGKEESEPARKKKRKKEAADKQA